MYQIIHSNNFRRKLKNNLKNGCFPREKLEYLLYIFSSELPLDSSFKNHKLQGQYKHLYECHLQPDILLIYERDDKSRLIVLVDIGSHSDLFG